MNKKKLLEAIKDRLRSERRNLRIKKNLKITQADVAEAVGISRSHLAAAESGHVLLSLETIILLANFYDVSVDFLIGNSSGTNKNHPHITLTDEERAFIRVLRAMDSNERQSLIGFLDKLNHKIEAA